jgi:hypothetical protein
MTLGGADARPYALSAAFNIGCALFVRLQRSWSTRLALPEGLILALG